MRRGRRHVCFRATPLKDAVLDMMLQKFATPDLSHPLFGERVATAWADPCAPMPRLIGDEVLALEHATAAHARRFGAGRSAARAAMEQLGHVPRPVLQGDRGAPVWPQGLAGSISHAPQDTLAAVTDDPTIRALGLKITPARALESACWPEICTIREMRWLASLGPSQRGHFARLLECLKLAVFKAHSQISPAALHWHDIELKVELGTRLFEASLLAASQQPEASLRGRFLLLSDGFVAGVEWR